MRTSLVLIAALSCAAADLGPRLDERVKTGGWNERASVGIHVVDIQSGEVLYRLNSERLFLPASNMKLFTTALALLRLGPDYRFVTRVILEPTGNLALIGSGDPSLSGRAFPYRKDAPPGARLQAIEDLAEQALAGGLRRVQGDVTGDDSLYAWEPYAPSWTQDDALREFGAPVSALSVNDNAVILRVRPGARAGDSTAVSVEPALEYLTVNNRVMTAARGSEPSVHFARSPGSREVTLTGMVPAGHAGLVLEAAMDDPALYAANALCDALTRRGVVITGRPVARHRSPGSDYQIPDGTVVASRTSPPLDQLLQMTDKVSQNLYAELMLREVGRVKRGSGTREAGLEELAALIAETGGTAQEAHFEDGSGLSRNALVSPRLITRLLAYMAATQYRDTWISLLPVGGEDGTLEHRLCCVTEGRGIRAKTGSLDRAQALSGYADSKTRGRLAFSILVNDFPGPASEVRGWIDKIAGALLE